MTTYAGLYGPETLLDGAGRPLRLVNVVVLAADGVTPAVLYTSRAKTATTPSNTVQTTTDGNLSFFADPGAYRLRWTVAGVTHTLDVEVAQDFVDQGGAVLSVNGRTGVVALVAADVGADVAGAASTAVAGHVAAADPHGDRADAASKFVLQSAVGVSVAQLVGGKVPSGQIPSLSWVRSHAVANQAAMLALTGVTAGEDLALRQDGAGTFLLTGSDPSQLASWTLLPSPTDAVVSVNGRSGAVVLAASDVGADASGAATTVQSNLTTHTSNTSNPHATTAAQAGAPNVVVHGSTAGTTRPAGATLVLWIGSVAPSNAATNDWWWDTSVELSKRWSGSAWKASGSASYGAVGLGKSLAVYGLDNSTADIKTIFDAAVADGCRSVVVPYRAAAWVALTKILLSDMKITFEPGARISFDHAVQGMELTRCTLHGASFTSIYTGPVTVGDATSATYGFPAREVKLNDDCTISGGYYHEYAVTGLHGQGANIVFDGPVTVKHIRHQQGWGAAIHFDTTAAHHIRGSGPFHIEDSDRGIEIEDGANDINLSGGGYLKDIFPKGYANQASAATYANYTFVIGAHAHAASGGVQGIAYDGTWTLENCGSGAVFVLSTGSAAADMPRDCRVEEVRFIGRGFATGYEDIALQGRHNHVGRAHFEVGAGITGLGGSAFTVQGYGGGTTDCSIGSIHYEGTARPTIADAGGGLSINSVYSGSEFLSTFGDNPALVAQILTGGSVAIVTANQGIAVRMKARKNLLIGLLEWVVGTQSGNYDIALLDASGARLWSKGSTAVPTGGTQVTETVTPAVAINRGTTFYVIIAFDNTTATLKGVTIAFNEMLRSVTGEALALVIGSMFPVPSSVGLGSTAATRLPLITVREA